MKRYALITLIGFFFGSLSSFAQSSNLSAQIGRVVSILYHTYDYQLAPISFNKETLPELSRKIKNDKVYTLDIHNKLAGYVYWGQSASKDHLFDFLIFLDPKLTITHLHILTYREQFGREITNQRWLKQFIGMSPTSTIGYGKTVDGISGATISAKSMTYAVKQVLSTVKTLQDNHLL